MDTKTSTKKIILTVKKRLDFQDQQDHHARIIQMGFTGSGPKIEALDQGKYKFNGSVVLSNAINMATSMNVAEILNFPEPSLARSSKKTLIQMVVALRRKLERANTESQQKIASLEEQVVALKEQLTTKDAELTKLTKQNINKTVNQPSSKQPEFDKNTGKAQKKKKRKKNRAGRKGAGNRSKPEPTITNHHPLTHCPDCETDLSTQPVTETVERIIEDIPPIPEPIVSKEVQERKWCPTCAKIVSSVSEAALPRSDIGLRSLALIAYLWVVSAISLPGIAAVLKNFFQLTLSTAGISRMMIRLANIMTPVYEEILRDVKGGTIIFADETGWRVKGVLWWLWIFANNRAAFYWPDRQRSSAVVEKILGSVFSGILVTDAWYAYMKIICLKQTCMAHILRKIRKFRDTYPQYYSVLIFYQRLKRILSDGEQLQIARKELDEVAFNRRLGLLKMRLDKLLAWKNPNKVLKEVIAKVARQSEYILTFVEYEGVPNHNNYGEYIIKKGILKRKVSGGSMSEAGVIAYATLQSIAQTCYLRKLSFLKFLTTSLIHYIRTGTPLLLSQYESQQSHNVQKKAA